MSAKRCAREECGKAVYPIEELKCLDKVWHKGCFRCTACGMTLNMKNYKGYNKMPYCEPHYPKTVASVVADTPEMRRIAENTKLQSQVKYHADYEKMKGTKIEIADDPEVTRHMKNSAVQSHLTYTGELDKRKKQEEVRPQNVEADSADFNRVVCPAQNESATPNPAFNNLQQQSTLIYSSDKAKLAAQPQRTVGSIADYDPLAGNWGSIGQSQNAEKINDTPRYCVDFTEEISGKVNGSSAAAPATSPSKGGAGFAVKAIYDYTAADKDEVSFLEGDIIVNCEKIDEGWLTGTVQRSLAWGMVPANYVQPHKLPTGLHRIK